MYKDKSFLAIIPARGGSKRLPRKNILLLDNKPLIAYTIEAGNKSKYIDTLIVTSDNNEILHVAKQYNVDILKRAKELASDTASTFDAIADVLDRITRKYDYVILLQPTSPLRDEADIDKAIELLMNKDADAIISVCKMDHNPLWSNILDDSLSMQGFIKDEILNKRSQDLDSYYKLNGAIYICDTKRLQAEKTFFLKKNIFAYKMSNKHSIDIDEGIDFLLAKTIIDYEKLII